MMWLAYTLAILMVWYENRWIVCRWPIDRPEWFSPLVQPMFFIGRSAVTYGAIIGLWLTRDLMTAVIAFGAYYAFNKFTFKYYFNREVWRTAQRYAKLSFEEAQQNNEGIDEFLLSPAVRTARRYTRMYKLSFEKALQNNRVRVAILQESEEMARERVVRNMKGENS